MLARDRVVNIPIMNLPTMHNFQLLTENAPDIICSLDLSGRLLYVSPMLEKTLGYAKEAWVHHLLAERVHSDDRKLLEQSLVQAQKEIATVDCRVVHQDGSILWFELMLQRIDSDFVQGIVCVMRHLRMHTRKEHVHHMIRCDMVTGLPNRLYLTEHLRNLLHGVSFEEVYFAVVMFDLDRFKLINDSLGHEVGDQILRITTSRIRGIIRADDILVHWGGDEFVLILKDLKAEQEVNEIVSDCLNALALPVLLQEKILHIHASAGIAIYPHAGNTANELLRNADIAMFKAKAMGGGRLVFFVEEFSEQAKLSMSIEHDLYHAIENHSFELYYQPIIAADSKQIQGLEALLRWCCNGEYISPEIFIPIAEETGLILQIGAWVLTKACHFAVDLLRQNLIHSQQFVISVNVSACQFHDANFVDFVASALKQSGLPAHHLQLELTESAIMVNPKMTSEILKKMRMMGVEIAIDDFGTGYSSLAYLAHFPSTRLKIDRSFVQNMTTGHADATIVKATTRMAHELGMSVIAEGVETGEQENYLMHLGCEQLQGYLFEKPLPAHLIRQRLATIYNHKESIAKTLIN